MQRGLEQFEAKREAAWDDLTTRLRKEWHLKWRRLLALLLTPLAEAPRPFPQLMRHFAQSSVSDAWRLLQCDVSHLRGFTQLAGEFSHFDQYNC